MYKERMNKKEGQESERQEEEEEEAAFKCIKKE